MYTVDTILDSRYYRYYIVDTIFGAQLGPNTKYKEYIVYSTCFNVVLYTIV